MHTFYVVFIHFYWKDMRTTFSLLGGLNVASQQKKPVATNAMHFQSTHSPSPQIYSTSSRIHIWSPVGGLRWSCFSRGAPSMMFDGILNAMLCLRRFPSLGLHKEILNSPCPLIFLIYGYSQSNHSHWSNLYHFLVHQPAATNSMHFQSNPPPPPPSFQIASTAQSDLHLEAGRKSAMKLFCGNSQSVKPIGYFSGGAPSLMSDGILNVIPWYSVWKGFHHWVYTRESWTLPAS